MSRSAHVVDADVMRPGELRQKLGLQHSRFGLLQQLGRFRHLESPVSAALGTRVYDRRRVQAWMDGQPLVVLRRRTG